MDENLLNKPVDNETQNLDVPQKFLDPETGELRIEVLLKSYMALEKKLSEVGSPSLSDPEQRQRVLKELGCPDCVDDYQIDVSHGLFDRDDELNQKLFEKGFTNDQVQMVYDLAAEKLVPMILDLAAEFEADREIERLIQEFGGKEKWQELSRQLLAYGQQNLSSDVLAGLANSYEGVMALYRMMSSDQPALNKQASSEGALDETKLKSMMADPKYWKNKDPAFIAKVTEGFSTLYGDK